MSGQSMVQKYLKHIFLTAHYLSCDDVQNIIISGTDIRKMKEIAERIELFLDRVEVTKQKNK